MKNADFSTVASQVIDGIDSTSQKAIEAWREGGERLGEFAGTRWDSAFKKASPELSAETRRNATRAKKAFAGYYAKGVAMSASGAEVAAQTLVQAARTAVERAAAWQQTRA
jgi:hypothetical protein